MSWYCTKTFSKLVLGFESPVNCIGSTHDKSHIENYFTPVQNINDYIKSSSNSLLQHQKPIIYLMKVPRIRFMSITMIDLLYYYFFCFHCLHFSSSHLACHVWHFFHIVSNFNTLVTLTLLMHAGLLWCSHNPLISMDNRIYNMCMWYFYMWTQGTTIYGLIQRISVCVICTKFDWKFVRMGTKPST